MNLSRRTANTAGVFFLLTEVGGLAATALYSPIPGDPRHITGAGADDMGPPGR